MPTRLQTPTTWFSVCGDDGKRIEIEARENTVAIKIESIPSDIVVALTYDQYNALIATGKIMPAK